MGNGLTLVLLTCSTLKEKTFFESKITAENQKLGSIQQ